MVNPYKKVRKLWISAILWMIFGSAPLFLFMGNYLNSEYNGQYPLSFFSNHNVETSGNVIPDYPDAKDELKFGNGEDLPNNGYLSGTDYNIFWWIHITDTQNVWVSESRINDMIFFLDNVIPLVKPTFTINTGDLVDSDYAEFILRSGGQRQWEWELYNSTFAEHNMNYTNFFDIVGNHDIYQDPEFDYYINYSISGQYFKTDQFLVNLIFPWGKYSFYQLSVTEDYGIEYPFALGGHMSKSEMAWFEGKLMQNEDANLSFAFGHQPPHQVFSALSPSGKMFIPLMKRYHVDYFGCGHEHINTYQNIGGIASVETQQFKRDSGCYRIVSIDNDGIATSFQTGREFPIGIITNPIDIHHAIGDYDMEKHANPNKVRALAWDPSGINKVEWRADSSESWTLMNPVEGPLYDATFDTSLIDGKEHSIEIKITNNEADTKIESIVYKSTPKFFFGWNEGIPFLIASFIAIVFVIPITKFILRRKYPERHGHKEGNEIDMHQAKLLFIKFLILLCVPLTFTFVYNNSLTVVFSLFLIAKVGFIYTDIPLLFFAATAFVGLLPVALNLGKKQEHLAIPWLFLSLIIIGFSLVFYIAKYPTISWISPGFYLSGAMDVLMIIRAINIRRAIKNR
ncbi:MAG: hypothetical protein GF364_22380 [Candidatus Lokiarchaeota archaeon]|nr:hypothetical protein [Candidatus Lokiarchaeota archaeon]